MTPPIKRGNRRCRSILLWPEKKKNAVAGPSGMAGTYRIKKKEKGSVQIGVSRLNPLYPTAAPPNSSFFFLVHDASVDAAGTIYTHTSSPPSLEAKGGREKKKRGEEEGRRRRKWGEKKTIVAERHSRRAGLGRVESCLFSPPFLYHVTPFTFIGERRVAAARVDGTHTHTVCFYTVPCDDGAARCVYGQGTLPAEPSVECRSPSGAQVALSRSTSG